MATKRLFFGIRPDPGILRELEARQQVFRENEVMKALGEDCRWVRAQDFHITLHFLGLIETRQELEIREVIRRTRWGGACVQRLDHVAAFPQKSRATVAGIGGLNGPLEELHMKMKPLLMNAGVILEKRRFYPHVTLVRFRSALDWDGRLPVIPPIDVNVKTVILFQSLAGKGKGSTGSRYEILEEFPLAPA